MDLLFRRACIGLVSLYILFSSCNSSDQTKDVVRDTTVAITRPTAPETSDRLRGCYMKVTGRDTLFAEIKMNGNIATGRIWFDNYQYDGSSGTLKGSLTGDELRMFYDFQAEGTKNTMELVFKIKDSSLIRGEGEMKVKGDTAYFADPVKTVFPPSGRLDKVDCSLWTKD